MVSAIEYLTSTLGLTGTLFMVVCAVLVVTQIVGELIELCGKTVPEILKVRKWIKRRKLEKKVRDEATQKAIEAMPRIEQILDHYNSDNIGKRNEWMQAVNDNIAANTQKSQALGEKVEEIGRVTTLMLIEGKKSELLNFAAFVADERNPVSREQFSRYYKQHEEYEILLDENGLTNGETDTAHRVVEEEYAKHLREHTFLEDKRGY